MNKLFTKITSLALGAAMMIGVGVSVGSKSVGSAYADTYEQLTSISNIDGTAEYVLGVEGNGFHYSGTSSWGLCAKPSTQTPLKYTLVKSSDGNTFKAYTSIGGTTYYLQVPTSNTFSMNTSSSAANTSLIIGTTQVSGTNYAVANSGTTNRHLRLNGTSGLRSYAGTTGSMAFFYKVVASTTSYTITYVGNEPSGTATNMPTNTSSAATDNFVPNKTPELTGYTFVGWNTNQSATTGLSPIKISGNTTLYAVWEENTPTPVASGTWELTSLSDLTSDDVFVFVGSTSTTSYAMTNDNGTGNPPSAPVVTIKSGLITSTVSDNMKWNLSVSNGAYTFYPDGETETWLYITNTNNGVRVGTGSNNAFTLSENNYFTANPGKQRYIGVYTTNPDWRCYDSETGNIANQTFTFYKFVEETNDTTTSLSVNPSSWSGYNSDTINLSSFSVSCETTASDDGYVFQGIGSGAGDNFVGRDADKSSFSPKTTDTRLQWKAKYPQTAGGDTYLYAYVSLTVTADTVSSVSASVADKTYYEGSKLSASDFTVSAEWSHAGQKTVTSDFTWTVNGVADGTLSYGSNTVIVTYEGVSSSNITVTATYEHGKHYTDPLSVTETISGYATYKDGNYYVGGYINEWHETKSGDLYAIITAAKHTTQGDNSNRIEIYGTVNFVQGSADDYVIGTKIVAFGTIGQYSGKYEVMDYQNKIDIWVTETESPSSLTIKTNPNTTTYSVGNNFDPTGLVVTVTYESRTVEVEYDQTTASGFTFSPSLDTALTASDTSVEVTYAGVSADVAIIIDTAIHTNSVTLKIGAQDAPESLSRTLDAGDMTLTAVLDPVDTEDELTWSSSDEDLAIVLGGEVTFGNETGTVTITAESGGKSDSIEITLTDPSDAYVYSIAIVEGAGVVKDYYNDTDLDTTGLSVTATLKSNNVSDWSKEVENYTTNITWSLDRADGFVIARYNNSETVYDLMEVTIHNTDKPQEFVLSYSGDTIASTETSYDLGEYITVPTNWTVTALKNSCTNNVGLNKAGQFKLYSDKTGGDGNMITVESNDSAVNIKSVTLSITGTCTHEVTKTGGVVVSGSGETYQINASSFSVQNTHTGSNTNTMSINSITVAFGYVDSFVATQTFEKQFIKRDIDYPETTPTGVPGVACLPTGEEGHLGYFDTAVAEYNKMSDAQSRIWFASRAEFAKARERFIAWGKANSKTVTFDTTTGAITVTPIGMSLINNMFATSESTATTVIIIISVIGVSALGGFFFLRKRKEI